MNSEEGHRFIDLFAGLGGFRIGMERNGFTCVFGSDFDRHSSEIYQENFGGDILSDVSKLDADDIPDFNVLCAGFPCQPFSSAGRQAGFGDTRGTLFFDLCRIIEAKKPEVVFLENVKNLTTHDSGNTFRVIQEKLSQLGYTVSFKVLNAIDFGVPQARERIVIIGSLSGKEFDFSRLRTNRSEPLYTFLDEDGDHEWLDEDSYVILDDSLVKTQSKTGLRFTGYRKGKLRVNGVRENAENLSRSHKQQNRIYSADGMYSALSSQESSGRYFIHTEKPSGEMGVRKLSMDECFRIFGFPESYVRIGTPGEQYRRIGNSICVPMVEEVSRELKNQLLKS